MPCSDCLTPTLHVRTTTPFSLLRHTGHTINLFHLSVSLFLSFLSRRAGEVHPFAKDFPDLPHISPPSLIHGPRPNQPFLSEIFRRPRACTSLHLTPPQSFPRPEEVHRPIPGTCSTLPLVPFFSDQTGDGRGWKSLYHTREQAGSTSSKRMMLLSFFYLWLLDFSMTVRIEKEISTERSYKRIFTVYRCKIQSNNTVLFSFNVTRDCNNKWWKFSSVEAKIIWI